MEMSARELWTVLRVFLIGMAVLAWAFGAFLKKYALVRGGEAIPLMKGT